MSINLSDMNEEGEFSFLWLSYEAFSECILVNSYKYFIKYNHKYIIGASESLTVLIDDERS